MKTKHIIFLLAIIVTGLALVSCNKIKSLTKITVHPQFTADIQVNIPTATKIQATNGSYNFDDSVTIDPTTDTLVTKYKSDIQSWEVDSITGIFTNVSTPVNLSNVSLQIITNTETFGWQFSSISIDEGTNLVLNDDQGQLDKLGQLLNGLQPFKVTLSGTSDQDDVHFTLSVKINTTMVANPLGSV